MGEGKIIAIEGGDFSGKATQTDELFNSLEQESFSVKRDSFPKYDTPTGKIIAGPLLGKAGHVGSFFPEGPGNIPKEVAVHYYVADRVYNRKHVLDEPLEEGKIVLLDRYIDSNMAHQGGKISDPEKRKDFYKWVENLEYNEAGLPKPDLTLFLYFPFEKTLELRESRDESPDQLENDKKYLQNSINAYLQLSEMYDHWKRIDCVNKKGEMRSKGEIHEDVYKAVKNVL